MSFKTVHAWALTMLFVVGAHSSSHASDVWRISHDVRSSELPDAPRVLSVLFFDQEDATAPFEVRHLEAEQWRLEVDLSDWPLSRDQPIPVRADLKDMQAYEGSELWAEMQIDGEAVGERFLLEVSPGVGLKVEGPIESGAGGFVFPDQSVQETAMGGTDSVTADAIAPGAVGSSELAPDAVTSAAIAPGAVGTSELAGGAVTAAKIDSSEVQSRVTGTCPAGSSIRVISSTGSVTCESDDTAVWAVNGSNTYYTNGNVGIGTSNPTEELSVSGSTHISNDLLLGTTARRAPFTMRGPDDPLNGPTIFLFGNSSDQVESGRIRFVEGTASTNWRGGFMHYDGSANALHIGTHDESNNNIANDRNAISINRSSRDVTVDQDLNVRREIRRDFGDGGFSPAVPVAFGAVNGASGSLISATANVIASNKQFDFYNIYLDISCTSNAQVQGLVPLVTVRDTGVDDVSANPGCLGSGPPCNNCVRISVTTRNAFGFQEKDFNFVVYDSR